MKAKLVINMMGNPEMRVGHVVEGEEAVRLVEAGFATPVVEEKPVKTATKKPSPKKETR